MSLCKRGVVWMVLALTTNRTGVTPAALIFPAAMLLFAPVLHADETVRLREKFPAGYQYHVSTRVDLSGTMSIPADKGQPKSLAMTGTSAIEYDERVVASGPAGVEKTFRIYRRVDFQRKVGLEAQQG